MKTGMVRGRSRWGLHHAQKHVPKARFVSNPDTRVREGTTWDSNDRR
jgi:hypothetical protein